jgi:SAM-dependent methyltransferase
MSRLRLLFAINIFLGAFLLFLVEPMAARQLLPMLGGSAAVWITCLVFFQTALLLGYLYAHLGSRKGVWAAQIALLAVAAAEATRWSYAHVALENASDHPVWSVFRDLSAWIGLPFIVLAATSPLLQLWWSRVESGEIPWRFYALSNVSSLLALALYPSVVEPYLTLHAQRLLWFWLFVVFALLSILLALKVRKLWSAPRREDSVETPIDESAPPKAPLARKLLWFLLPMGAAMQLSAGTSYLTANIAAIPLLWILPLSVYLVTIIVAFQVSRRVPHVLLSRLLIVILASLGYSLSHVDVSWPLWVSITIFLVEIFLAGLFCHCEAVALRPARPSESTLFYLLFAAGGALGSFFIGIACPLLFSFNYDLPITVVVTALLALAVTWNLGRSQRILWAVASVMLMALLIMVHIAYQRDSTVAVRNFYGALRVKQTLTYPGFTKRTLMNGIIEHGTQVFGSNELRKTPTTYYARDSGVGLALQNCCPGPNPDPNIPRPRRIGVIGLGAGTIAAYGRPGDRIRFYEINPDVVPIARNVFTYIRESGAQVDIVVGDARSSLAREEPQQFDVLVIDAFSGDAIPIHLLTREALAIYRRHLARGGILAFHISNRHVDLEPAIALLGASADMEVRHVLSKENDKRGEYNATWMLVTDNAAFFLQPDLVAHAFGPDTRPGLRLWTDDYSALLPLLRW